MKEVSVGANTVEVPENAADLLALVSKDITDFQSNGELTNRVVNVFAEREISKRADLLVRGFDKLSEVTKAFNDINKADGKTFLAQTDGTPSTTATLAFSAKRIEEIAKARKTLDKITNAIGVAINSANFSDLEKALKGGGSED